MAFLNETLDNEYLHFLTIFVGTVIFLFLSYVVLKIVVKRMKGNKKNYWEFIVKKLSMPIFYIIFFLGLFTSLKNLSIIDFYEFTIEGNNYTLIDGVFFIILTFAIALLVSRILNVLMKGMAKVKKDFQKPPGLIHKVISFIIFIVAIFVILGYFKIDITPMVAGVGLGALAVGLALQSTLSNFFAGVHLLSDKPIDVGDYIEVDENTKGTVEDIGWRSTRIRTLTDNLLIIPNGKLAESNITNFSKPKQDMSIWVPCGVAYESDLNKVEKITLEVAKEIQQKTDGAVKDFEPVFRYREFGDSNINFITVLRVNGPGVRFAVRNEFIILLKKRFDMEKIEISWPIRKIYNMK